MPPKPMPKLGSDLPAEGRIEVERAERRLGAQEAAGERGGVLPLGGQAERRGDAQADLPGVVDRPHPVGMGRELGELLLLGAVAFPRIGVQALHLGLGAVDVGVADGEFLLLDERQTSGVVEERRRIIGLRGEGSAHAHRLGALLENAEAGRIHRSGHGNPEDGNPQGLHNESSSPSHAFAPPLNKVICGPWRLSIPWLS